jgi:hypothetical protein
MCLETKMGTLTIGGEESIVGKKKGKEGQNQ